MRAMLGTRLARAVWLIPGSRRFYTWLIGRLKPSTVQIDGHTFELDPTDSLLLSVNGEYEPVESRIFRRYIREGATVIDVGGHIGYYTLQAARAVGPDGHVVVFEPAPDNFALLERNVKSNGYKNVTLVRSAVSDQAGSESLVISRDNTGDNRLAGGEPGSRVDARAAVDLVTVDAVTLDSYFGEKPPDVDVIKMDIQGAEPLALAGGRGLIAANDDLLLLTELSSEHLDAAHLRAYGNDLKDAGFALFEIDESSGMAVRVEVEELVARLVADSGITHTDLACVKGDRASARLREVAGVK